MQTERALRLEAFIFSKYSLLRGPQAPAIASGHIFQAVRKVERGAKVDECDLAFSSYLRRKSLLSL